MSPIKTYIMKAPITFFYLLIGILFFTFASCQDDVIEETPPSVQGMIQAGSKLANLMRHSSANDGSVADLMDTSECFALDSPATIVANGVTLTIETLDHSSVL